MRQSRHRLIAFGVNNGFCAVGASESRVVSATLNYPAHIADDISFFFLPEQAFTLTPVGLNPCAAGLDIPHPTLPSREDNTVFLILC